MIGAVMSSAVSKQLRARALFLENQVKDKVTSQTQILYAKMFRNLVASTPQWSGNLASNWRIVVGRERRAEAYSELPSKKTAWGAFGVFAMGDDPAVSSTVAREAPKLADLKWNSVVAFVNVTPYAAEVQAGLGPLDEESGERRAIREENLGIAGRVMMAESFALAYNGWLGPAGPVTVVYNT